MAHQQLRLDAAKIRRAKKALKAGTDTETIERAVELVISEHRRNRLAFPASGVSILDMYGKLER